jgi:plasmid stabilization system protein ParE
MAHQLSPRAQADIDDIAYDVAVESGESKATMC